MARRPDIWRSGQMSVRTDDTSSRRLTGNRKSSDLKTVQNLLNSEIPVMKHLYKQVILSKQNVANYNLTNSPFGHSGTKIT